MDQLTLFGNISLIIFIYLYFLPYSNISFFFCIYYYFLPFGSISLFIYFEWSHHIFLFFFLLFVMMYLSYLNFYFHFPYFFFGISRISFHVLHGRSFLLFFCYFSVFLNGPHFVTVRTHYFFSISGTSRLRYLFSFFLLLVVAPIVFHDKFYFLFLLFI